MTIRVLLFAKAREMIGSSYVDLELGEHPSLDRLRSELAERHPELKMLLQHSRFSVNHEFREGPTRLNPHDEVAWIPPVSGG